MSKYREAELMHRMGNIFVMMYVVAPIAAGALISALKSNWLYLVAIPFSYLGVLTWSWKRKLCMLPILAAVGYWLQDGFNWGDKVTVCFMFFIGGGLLFGIADAYKMEAKKTLLEIKDL